MSENTSDNIIKMIDSISSSVGQTMSAIATIKELKRTTGISKRQEKRLKRELETNITIADEFKKWCEENPGILWEWQIGNMKLKNIGKVLDYAQLEFDKKDDNIPQQVLDEDWIAKFLDVSGETSNDEKQKILAKVLCGELKKPNSISYRTLRVLKDMSINDINLFKRALSVSFHSGRYVFILKGLINSLPIDASEIMNLRECGLLDNSDFMTFHISTDNSTTFLLSSHNQYLLKIREINSKTDISIDGYFFTESAIELYNLIDIVECDIDLLKKYLNSSTNKNWEIALHSVISIDGGKYKYDTKNLLLN